MSNLCDWLMDGFQSFVTFIHVGRHKFKASLEKESGNTDSAVNVCTTQRGQH